MKSAFGMALFLVMQVTASFQMPSDESQTGISGPNPPPPRIAVLIDFSGSMAQHKVDHPTVNDLLPLIGLCDLFGCELGIGRIDEDSGAPLLRLTLPPPEPGLEKPDVPADPFTRNRLNREYLKKLPEYEHKEQVRRGKNAILIEAFKLKLEAFLAQPLVAQRTDIWSNTRRAQVFLLEPSLYWTRNSNKGNPALHILIVSDGVHNVESSVFRKLDSSIEVSAVCGDKGLGDLSKLGKVNWFESPGAAIRYISTSIMESSHED